MVSTPESGWRRFPSVRSAWRSARKFQRSQLVAIAFRIAERDREDIVATVQICVVRAQQASFFLSVVAGRYSFITPCQ